MEAEPSAFAGLPILLMGLFIFAMGFFGRRAAKKNGESGVYFGGDADSGGGGDGGGGD